MPKILILLHVKVITDTDSLRLALLKGEGDIIAYGLAVTKERQKHVDFTSSLMNIKQVLVQENLRIGETTKI